MQRELDQKSVLINRIIRKPPGERRVLGLDRFIEFRLRGAMTLSVRRVAP